MFFGEAWLQRLFHGALKKSAARCSEHPRRRRERRLTSQVEVLESRSLPTGLGLISGTVFDDLSGNGLSVDDPVLAAIAVSLYRDGGNGTFDAGGGDDVLIGTQPSDAQGKYEFEYLSAGRYFVAQAAVPGHQQRAGANVVTQTISAADELGVPHALIDDFGTTTQTTSATTSVRTNSSAIAAPEAIGGERDFFLQLSSATGMLTLDSNGVTPGVLEFNASAVASGRRMVSWDGIDGNGAVLNATGLGGFDLTDGGTARYLEFLAGADHANGVLQIRVYSDATHWSLANVNLPDTGGAATSIIPLAFKSFVAQAGGGANFASIGAIEMEVTGGQAVDGQLELIQAYGPAIKTVNFANFQPLSLGDLVWNDTNDDGQFNGVESGISGVAIDLYEDTNGSNDFTPGVDAFVASTTTDASGKYRFDALFPSNYVVRVSATNFAAGAALRGFNSSIGNAPTPDPDNNVNNDDNGDPLSGQGVVSKAVTLTAMAEPTNDGDSNANTNLSVDFGFVPTIDLSIDKTDDADPIVAGNILTYTLAVTNLGQSTATGVTVSDPLPAGVTFLSASTTQGSVSQSNGTVTATIGSLAEGATATVTVRVRVASGTTGTLSNTATVTGNQRDTVPGNNSDTEPTVVIARTDLEITKTDDVDPVVAGDFLTYTLTITNHGPSNATGVTVSDPLLANVTFDSATTTQGSVSFANGTLAGTLGNIANGNSATITVRVRVSAAATGSLTNTATVTGDQPDTVPGNNSATEPTAIIARTDLEIDKTDDADPVTAGDLLTYTLFVTNHGPSNATGVVASDPLPAGTTFVSASSNRGTVSTSNGVVSANIGNLAFNGTATVTVTVRVNSSTIGTLSNTATVTGNQPDPVPGNNSDTEPTVVVTRTDLAIDKRDDVDPVTAGELLTYTLVLTNFGPSDATGVRASDPLPAGTTFVSATTTRGSISVANGVLTATVGNLANNASETVTVVVRVNSSTTSNLSNTATVTGNQPDTVPGNNSDTEPTLVVTRADLGIDKSDNVDPVTAGNLLIYTLAITNYGPSDATGVFVSDPIPAGTTFVSATTTQGTFSVANGVLTGSLGNMVNGANATMTVTVRVNSSTTSNLNNTATVTGNQPDTVPGNNSDSEPTAVITSTDLELDKSDNADPVTAGQTLIYTLLVTNHGPSDATGVIVNDPLPAGTTFLSATTNRGTVSVSNGVVTGNIGNLANQATATITVTVRVGSNVSGTITNTGTVTGNQSDPNPNNNRDTEPTLVVKRTDLAIDKTDNVDPVTAGNLLIYTLAITNNGPSDATGVTVSDPIPAGTTFVSATTTQGTVGVASNILTANLGGLANGANATVTVTVRVDSNRTSGLNNTATVTGNETDTVPGNNSDSEPTAVVTSADLEIVKTDNVSPVTAGTPLTYTLFVTNHGPSDATGVIVSDPLPAGTTFVSATSSQGTFSVVNGVVTANVGNVANNGTATVLVTVLVAASRTTELSNTATVTATPPDPIPPNNQSNRKTPVTPKIDLEIQKSDDVDPVIAGQSLTYTLLILNHGPSNATGVTVVDALPAGLTFVSATSTQGSVSFVNGTLTASVGNMNLDGTATITLRTTVNSSTTGTLSNTATVTGNETELNSANNQDTEPTTVVTLVDLAINKSVSATPVEFNTPFSYTLLVSNNGPSDSTGVTVVDALPTGLVLDSATTTRGTVASVNGTITANIGNLARSATATVTLIVRSMGTVTGTITNTATVSGRETETTLTNNTSQAVTFLEPRRARIAGSVYIDANDNGRFDANEKPIAGVIVTLVGTDLFGNAVNVTQPSGTDGAYNFENLRPGTYALSETQPTGYKDGKDTASTVLSSTTTDDRFGNLVLTAGMNANGFLFGELPQVLTKRSFLASTPSGSTLRTAPIAAQKPKTTPRR